MFRLIPIFALWLLCSTFVGAQADYKKYYDEDRLPVMRSLFERGRYSIVIQNCDYAIRRGQLSPEWLTLKMKSKAALGRYEEALLDADTAAKRYSKELPTLLDVYEMYRTTGQEDKQTAIRELINAAASAVPAKDRDSLDLVHLGKAALVLGADPAMVLENYYTPAKRVKKKGKDAPPGLVEAHQAAGELALEKSDFKLAAQEFRAALRHAPNHPELRYGLARAFLPDDRKAGMAEIDKILENHSFHFGALLLRAEFAINFEKYNDAHAFLKVIHGINPQHPEAWALRAVLAELQQNDQELFREARDNALSVWKKNPEVDHLIGRVLSRNYRFAEGSRQPEAGHPVRSRLSPRQVAARSGLPPGSATKKKAWPLAREVAEADQYNVLAYNLEILEEEIESFATVKSDNFTIRLPANEAEIYGDRALALLEEARALLLPKYGVELTEPTLVEFFPNQADFAVRSFGSLGGAGLLGVCFGSVVTMNSPGSLTHNKNNWEATLWHEFVHVVTLTATKNKMPRWLSEGISVYEEMQKQSNWGQRMTPRYRKMILEEDALTPVSKMSSAFYEAPSSTHIMFAYYESMLVVEYIVETFGIDALKNILADLANGVLINEAITKNTKELAALELEFEERVTAKANNLAPGVDWTTPDPSVVNPRSQLAVAAFLKKNPKSFWAHQTYTQQLLGARKWEEAIKAADDFITLFPDYVEGTGNGYSLKAGAYRSLGDSENEARTLRVLSEKSAEAYTAYSKLLSLDLDSENWPNLLINADRAMAINPFLKDIHYCRGCACQQMGIPGEAITSFEKLLSLKPANPSEVRYRLATLHGPGDTAKAKRYVMDALADSPRYREAFELFLSLENNKE